jgi:hypothetical protein
VGGSSRGATSAMCGALRASITTRVGSRDSDLLGCSCDDAGDMSDQVQASGWDGAPAHYILYTCRSVRCGAAWIYVGRS